MNYETFQTQDRRLVLLRALLTAARYRTNVFLLSRYCDAVGHAVSADRIEQDIAWLAEQSLVIRTQSEGVTIAELTARGQDVATGRTVVPGVQQPQPGA